jgi:hypothetical protein
MLKRLNVKYSLFCRILIKFEFFSTDFRKSLKYQVSSKSVHWEPSFSMRTDRRTNMTKLIVAFRNLANAPKNVLLYHAVSTDKSSPTFRRSVASFTPGSSTFIFIGCLPQLTTHTNLIFINTLSGTKVSRHSWFYSVRPGKD